MNANAEVDNNYAYFKSHFSEFEKTYPEKFALLHKEQAIEFFDHENDAIKAGMKDYGEGCFSVQQVADNSIDLGYQSYVII